MAEQTGAFMNRNVVLCRPGDPRLITPLDEEGGFEQAEYGPIMLVIGVDTSDDKCRRLAQRFGVSAESLMTFREQGRGLPRFVPDMRDYLSIPPLFVPGKRSGRTFNGKDSA